MGTQERVVCALAGGIAGLSMSGCGMGDEVKPSNPDDGAADLGAGTEAGYLAYCIMTADYASAAGGWHSGETKCFCQATGHGGGPSGCYQSVPLYGWIYAPGQGYTQQTCEAWCATIVGVCNRYDPCWYAG